MPGFDGVVTEEVIREGKKVEEILKQIDEDEDIAMLVLGASTETTGPGPLVSSLAAGTTAGKFPIPDHHRAGHLPLEESRRWPERIRGSEIAGVPLAPRRGIARLVFDPARPIY